MRKLLTAVLVVAIGVLLAALPFWAGRGDEARALNDLKEKSLCTLELPAGTPIAFASFTTSQTIDQFHIAVRPRGSRQCLGLSISGSKGLVGSVTTDATRYSVGRDIPPGTYELTLRQADETQGALVVVAGEEPRFVTWWQIYSRVYLGLLALAGVWAVAGRKSRSSRNRAVSLYIFHMLLLGFVVVFLYLLFHEGGHALAGTLFGRYDFARSDFWGIHGSPHSGGKSGPSLEPWQQALLSGAGPMLPTFVGWAAFVLWSSRFGRSLRNTRPVVNVYFSAIVAMLVFPLFAVAGCLLGVVSNDGDWNGVFGHVPGPLWLVKGLLWGVLLVNAVILWRVVPELWRSWRAQSLSLRK